MSDATTDYQEDEQQSDRGAYVVRATLAVLFLLLLVLFLLWFLWWRWSTVPDVTGMTEKRAVARLRDAGFESGMVIESILTDSDVEAGFHAGEVVHQTPRGGGRAVKGTEIDLRVAGGAGGLALAGASEDLGLGEEEYVVVPDVVGKQEDRAYERLSERTLKGASSTVVGVVRRGEVVDQSPEAGKRVKAGTTVHLQVSAGIGGGSYAGPVIPDVLGETLSSAKSILGRYGYGWKVRYGPSTTSVPKGIVYYQKPGAGDPVTGGTVTIWVSKGVLKKGSPYGRPEPD